MASGSCLLHCVRTKQRSSGEQTTAPCKELSHQVRASEQGSDGSFRGFLFILHSSLEPGNNRIGGRQSPARSLSKVSFMTFLSVVTINSEDN